MANITIKKIQEALVKRGFKPGEVDGIWGRRTIKAVKAFQSEEGLEIDGVVGPETSARLFSFAVPLPVLPWYEAAKQLAGTKEILGSKSNPVIMDWSNDLDIKYSGDDVPWCGLFVAHCIGSSLPDELLPKNPLGARQWTYFGEKTVPRVGAIMVFWRTSPESGNGHVGFYVGQNTKGDYQILGGNQSDKVCLTWISQERFLAARWPTSAKGLDSLMVLKEQKDGISLTEA